MFMGQSNMAGRGTAEQAPAVPDGTGYEYRAVTAPDCLFPLTEPFGKDENNITGVIVSVADAPGSTVTVFVCASVCSAQTAVAA